MKLEKKTTRRVLKTPPTARKAKPASAAVPAARPKRVARKIGRAHV